MAYILEMASGTEYLGDELHFPKPAVVPTPASPVSHTDQQVELRLTEVVHCTARAPRATLPLAPDLRELIERLDD